MACFGSKRLEVRVLPLRHIYQSSQPNWIRHYTFNVGIVGSSPAGDTFAGVMEWYTCRSQKPNFESSSLSSCTIWLHGAIGRHNGLKIHTVKVRILLQLQMTCQTGQLESNIRNMTSPVIQRSKPSRSSGNCLENSESLKGRVSSSLTSSAS